MKRSPTRKNHKTVCLLCQLKHSAVRSLNTVLEPGTKLDKDAAGRFIKHAIARFSKQPDQSEPTPPSVFVPVKVTSKMAARAEYERELREQPTQLSDEELQVFDDSGEDDDGSSIDIDEPSVESTDPALGNFDGNDQPQPGPKKRKRPSVDPFAGTFFLARHVAHKRLRIITGYGDETPTSAKSSRSHDTSHPESALTIDVKTNTSTDEKLSSQHFSRSKPQRKNKKKTVKQQTE